MNIRYYSKLFLTKIGKEVNKNYLEYILLGFTSLQINIYILYVI